jgi:hypothetical protein
MLLSLSSLLVKESSKLVSQRKVKPENTHSSLSLWESSKWLLP